MEGQNGEDKNEVSALVFVYGCCGLLFVQYFTIELKRASIICLDHVCNCWETIPTITCKLHDRITWTLIPYFQVTV